MRVAFSHMKLMAALVAAAMMFAPLSSTAATPHMSSDQMQHQMVDPTSADNHHKMAMQDSDCETHCEEMVAETSCASCCALSCTGMSAITTDAGQHIPAYHVTYRSVVQALVQSRRAAFDPPPPRI